ncbi:hypothetical protein [Streptacidiphilus sp. P02-A3a]|uniref:hypothetical protein n=1 Tax=Streptacidiphilus sp. P02-A3a TaxID=2704468 RepID=UPI0015FA42C9|nr:hypothetical protein [Streptacidiphilus sp. P02-A3a]QMU71624.1 hypothetical protein GXP74_28670 [Streptacidiphilus sp. P02-A3a]
MAAVVVAVVVSRTVELPADGTCVAVARYPGAETTALTGRGATATTPFTDAVAATAGAPTRRTAARTGAAAPSVATITPTTAAATHPVPDTPRPRHPPDRPTTDALS